MKKHVEGRTKEERSKVRKKLGTLKQLTVQPKTRIRYDNARRKFYRFLKDNQISLPRQREKLDGLVAEYVEFLWESGEGRGLASDTVASLQDFDPRLKGSLLLTWRLLKTWHVNEVPNRAAPLPERAIHAMIGWALFHEHFKFALSLQLGFYALLRTGEIHALTSSCIAMSSPNKPAVISLGLTKSGKRVGASESVTLTAQDVLKPLWRWKRQASPHEPLVSSPSQWRTMFSNCLKALGLEDFQFRPYSLRRGGSTFWFHKHGNFDRLLMLGRWQAVKTARIYLNDGLAMLAEMKLPQAKLTPFVQVYDNSLKASLPKLERTHSELIWGTWISRVFHSFFD